MLESRTTSCSCESGLASWHLVKHLFEVAVADGVLPPKPEPMQGKRKGVFDGAPTEEIRRHGPRNGGRGSSRWCTRASWTCLEGFSERVIADTHEVIDVLKWPAVGTREKAWFDVLSRTQAEYHSLFLTRSSACRCDFLERGSFVSVAALALCLCLGQRALRLSKTTAKSSRLLAERTFEPYVDKVFQLRSRRGRDFVSQMDGASQHGNMSTVLCHVCRFL